MLVVIRGAGDLATGIALRLHRAGYQIVMTDLPPPPARPRPGGCAAGQFAWER